MQTAQDTNDDTGATTADFDRLVVPVDASTASERGVAVARWLADALGAPIDLLHVEAHHPASDATAERLGRLAAANGARATMLAGDPVADVIATYALGTPRPLLCLATHGHDRSSAVIGSTAAKVAELLREPVVLVGPRCATDAPPAGAPIVVAVGGQPADGDLVHVAATWAARLGRPLVLATVIEPAPPTLRGDQLPSRAHGPADPDGYLAGLLPAGEAAPSVTPVVIDDPVGVADGLEGWLAENEAALVVVGAHHRGGLGRLLHGSTAARVAHGAPRPVLLVEIDWRG